MVMDLEIAMDEGGEREWPIIGLDVNPVSAVFFVLLSAFAVS